MDRVLYFAAGVIAGGIGAYIVLARKFEKDFQEATVEINKELKEIAESRHKAELGVRDTPEDGESDDELVVREAIEAYTPDPVDDPSQEEVVKRTFDRQTFEAQQISQKEFLAPNHQEHISITYYMEDDVFADNRGVPMQNTEWFDNIISGVSASDSIIYVRSMSRHADFEITLVDESYEHSVLGVEPYEDE